MDSTRIDSKQTLITAFGSEIGAKLYGAAVKCAARYNISCDDFCQDVAEAGLTVQREYGFVHIHTTINRAKNAVFVGYRYGVNRYYRAAGIREFWADAYDDTEPESEGLWDTLVYDPNAVIRDNLSAAFMEVFAALSDTDRAIMLALSEGWKATEIAARLSKSSAYVSTTKKRLQAAFAAFA